MLAASTTSSHGSKWSSSPVRASSPSLAHNMRRRRVGADLSTTLLFINVPFKQRYRRFIVNTTKRHPYHKAGNYYDKHTYRSRGTLRDPLIAGRQQTGHWTPLRLLVQRGSRLRG